MPASGIGISSFSIISRNWSRSSARSMASGVVPRILTPYFFRSAARFSGVCPPNCAITPTGIFQSQRLEIQLVGSVVVCGYRLRVTVYNDRGESELTQCFCSMYAAVIEFDTLTNSVRTAAEDHYLLFAVVYRAFVLDMIAGVIVCFKSASAGTCP